jgi:hypothetical protein
MYNALKMGKKAMTVSVVVATIAWSIGLAALLMPLAAGAASLTSGDLIKASQPAVYYYGADGKRYVFPNEKTYKTWYADFSSVKKITDAELAAIAIGGNATYKPAARMVKITTDPKVYVVDAGGTLRWVNSEQVAADLYGSTWNKMIDDVPDAFFVNYKVGSDVAKTDDFVKATVAAAAVSINVDKGLASASGGSGALTLAADAMTAPAGSIVADATDGGQRRAKMLKFKLSAGPSDVKISVLKFHRGGISKDGDVDNVLLMEGKTIVAESTSINSTIATFNLGAGVLTIPANTTKVLDLVVDLNKAVANGSTMSFSVAAADVTSDAASVSGSAAGNTMTAVVVTDLGSLKVGGTNTYPASVDPGAIGKEMWRVSFEAQSQDMLLTYVKFNNLGSSYDSDIVNLKLMDGATQLNGVVAQVKDKVVEFDMSTMTGGGYKILAGQSKQLVLVGDIVGGTSRTFKWSIQKNYDVRTTDLGYNVEAFVNNGTAATFAVIQAAAATNINTGTLSVGVATDSPSVAVTKSATGVTLAKFNFKASGEEVKVTDLTVICMSSDVTNVLKNTKVLVDGVQVGSTDATATCDATTDEAAFTFGNSFIIGAGKTAVVSIVGDLNDSSWTEGDTIYVGFGGTGAAQGKTSLTALTPTNVNGRTLSLLTGTVSVMKDTSFSDRSTTFPTGVANAQGVKIASFVIIAGSGENVNVSQIVLRDDETNQVGDDFQNMVLKDRDGNQIGATISSLNTAAGSYTFTPSASIVIAAGAQKAFDVYADVKGTLTNGGATAFVNLEIDSVSATGALTSSSANFGTSGNDSTDVALQKVYLATNGELTVTVAADTPTAQQLVLGSTGVTLAKFKLAASAAENIGISEIIVADDMTAGGAGTRRVATGSLKNLKLYNGDTLLASVASLTETYNTTSPYAVFTGFELTIPKNQNITLTVKGDLTSYDDGGVPSSSHRIFIPIDYKTSVAGADEPSTAVGAGSGFSITSTSLDLSANTDAALNGNIMDLVRAKLTLAHAADSPAGASTASSEQTVAKFVATNGSNIGNYSVTIKNLNFSVSAAGASLYTSAAQKVYKDSISTSNQLATTSYCTGTGVSCVYSTTVYAEASFTDLEIAAGSSRTIVVTQDTSTSGFSASETLSVGVPATGATWTDGNANSDVYYTVDGLPIAGKTLVF